MKAGVVVVMVMAWDGKARVEGMDAVEPLLPVEEKTGKLEGKRAAVLSFSSARVEECDFCSMWRLGEEVAEVGTTAGKLGVKRAPPLLPMDAEGEEVMGSEEVIGSEEVDVTAVGEAARGTTGNFEEA